MYDFGQVVAPGLKLHKTINSKVSTNIDHGARVLVLERVSAGHVVPWLRVRVLPDNREGWVAEHGPKGEPFIKLEQPRPPPNVEPPPVSVDAGQPFLVWIFGAIGAAILALAAYFSR